MHVLTNRMVSESRRYNFINQSSHSNCNTHLNPNDRHTIKAAFISKFPLHTLPQDPLWKTSTRPLNASEPPTRRNSAKGWYMQINGTSQYEYVEVCTENSSDWSILTYDSSFIINLHLPPSGGTVQLTATSSVWSQSWIPHAQPVQLVRVSVPFIHEKPSIQISPVPWPL